MKKLVFLFCRLNFLCFAESIYPLGFTFDDSDFIQKKKIRRKR
jgi:hypothetical protein